MLVKLYLLKIILVNNILAESMLITNIQICSFQWKWIVYESAS